MMTGKMFTLLALFATILAGCVERRLTINTNPSGAVVLLNDEEIGTTPVTVPFNWYGDYNVTIRKHDCETFQTHRNLPRPWYDYFPFDFFAGCLYPGRIIDSYEWSFDLTPQKEIDRRELISEAEKLKTEN